MPVKHKCQTDFSRSIFIAIAGAGGTGCALAASLGRMSKALRSILPEYRMRIEVHDPAPVRDANLGRQPYGACDVGLNKAMALANAVNLAFPAKCEAHANAYESRRGQQILAICVDSVVARRQIMEEIIIKGMYGPTYIVDCGNMKDYGQCLVGMHPSQMGTEDGKAALPPPWDVAPDLYDPSKDDHAEPSCSSAEALASQDFNVNHFAAMVASEHIWRLITRGEIETRGAFFNLRTMTCSPLKIEDWRQVGEMLSGRGQSGERYRLSILEAGSVKYLKHEALGKNENRKILHRIVNGEPIDPLSMKPFAREKNALWRNIETVLNNDGRMAA